MNKIISRTKVWSSVFCLAIAAFVFNTTEFVPVGLLPNIAESFSMNVAHTGLLITVYAWCVSLLSFPLTVLTAKFERHKLLIGLFIVFITSHLLAGMAWNFTSLMIARIGIACSHAVFWSIITPLAVRLAPGGKRAQAMGFIVAGTSIATVLGVPIGTIIGQMVGWRVTFLLIGGAALLVTIALAYLVPTAPSTSSNSMRHALTLFKRPTLLCVYGLTAITIIGHFTAYTYITPFMLDIGGYSEKTIVLLLLCIGFAGIIGSLLFTYYLDKYPIKIFLVPLILLYICLMLLWFMVKNEYLIILLCLCWGIAITLIGMTLQSKVLDAAPDANDVANAFYSGIYNIGIGGGALVGSRVIIFSSVAYVGFVGAIFVAISIIGFLFLAKRYWIIKQAD
ncbi:MAG: sugar transporter [Candidatus Schmidhempelia sp.]|nr:sugar transporter [Candidatus Schmidhempelia sp.]